MTRTLNLDLVPPMFRDQAVAAFEAGDPLRFVMSAGDNTAALDLVWRNYGALKARGILERVAGRLLLDARRPVAGRPSELRRLFQEADRDLAGLRRSGPRPWAVYPLSRRLGPATGRCATAVVD